MNWTRRHFTCMLIAGPTAYDSLPAHDACAPGRPLVEELFADLGAARELGRRVLRRSPGCGPAALEMTRELTIAADGSLVRLRRELAERVRADFAGDRVMIVDGWILATSEAYVCAVVAL